MNLTIERAPALAALSRIRGIVDSRGNIPILANVALKAEGSRLLVRATDLDMEASENIQADIREDGETTIPADKLYDIVRASDEGANLALSTDDTDPRVRVKSGRSNFRLPALSADAFPVFPTTEEGTSLVFPARTLADMLTRVAPFVDRVVDAKKSLYNLSCVFLTTAGDQLRAVAASNAGIALRREPRPEGGDFSAILPPKLTSRLATWLDDDGDVEISLSGSLIRFTLGSRTLTSKLFDLTGWVGYEPLLIEEHEAWAKTDRDALMASLRRVAIVSDGKTVYATFRGGEIHIQARGAETSGEGADVAPCEYDGPERLLKLRPSHTLDLLTQLKGDIVEIGFSLEDREGEPNTGKVIIRAPCDGSFTSFTMQMRV